MKTRLFNECEAYTEDANHLSVELEDVIRPILYKAAEKYPTRDIEVVALATINQLAAELVVRKAIEKNLPEYNEEAERSAIVIKLDIDWIPELGPLSPNERQQRRLMILNDQDSQLRRMLCCYIDIEFELLESIDSWIIRGPENEIKKISNPLGALYSSQFEIVSYANFYELK